MKKILLLTICFAIAKLSDAQLVLTDSTYFQDFDNIGSGLPDGWMCFTNATATSLGTDVTATKYYSAPHKWNSTFGEFRNCASSNSFLYYGEADSATQANEQDRALALRQVSGGSSSFPGSDPGGAFVLKIANTTGLSNFILDFQLQSLDSTVSRVATWKVDYGFGETPTTFTEATSLDIMETGGNTFTNDWITVDFGSALDNNPGPVWIRIVTLSATTGSGNRPTTGIDDYELNWDGIATGINSVKKSVYSLNILQSENNNLLFSYSSSKNQLSNAVIYDLSGRKLMSDVLSVTAGRNEYILSTAGLSKGIYLLSVSDKENAEVKRFLVK